MISLGSHHYRENIVLEFFGEQGETQDLMLLKQWFRKKKTLKNIAKKYDIFGTDSVTVENSVL